MDQTEIALQSKDQSAAEKTEDQPAEQLAAAAQTAEQFVPDEQTRTRAIVKSARRVYSRLAFGSIAALLIASVAVVLLLLLRSVMWWWSLPEENTGANVLLVMTVVGTHLIALPLVMRFFKKMPVFSGEKEKLGAGGFMACIPICVFLAYGGNILATWLNDLLKDFVGIDSSGNLDTLMDTELSMGVVVVFIGLLGPLMEELFFRRMLIDRMRGYGERTAVVVSAVMFGLFHGNLIQGIYATPLGLVFGYVYVRTENIMTTFALHAFVNLFSGALPLALTKDPAVAAFEIQMTEGDLTMDLIRQSLSSPGVAVYLVYMALTIFLSILGLVLLCIKAKKVHFDQAPLQLPKGKRFSSAWLNAGMICFIVVFVLLIFSVVDLF